MKSINQNVEMHHTPTRDTPTLPPQGVDGEDGNAVAVFCAACVRAGAPPAFDRSPWQPCGARRILDGRRRCLLHAVAGRGARSLPSLASLEGRGQGKRARRRLQTAPSRVPRGLGVLFRAGVGDGPRILRALSCGVVGPLRPPPALPLPVPVALQPHQQQRLTHLQ